MYTELYASWITIIAVMFIVIVLCVGVLIQTIPELLKIFNTVRFYNKEFCTDDRYVMANALCAVDDIMKQSDGVYGLHLNGDNAPWEELKENDHLWVFDRAATIARRIVTNYQEKSW